MNPEKIRKIGPRYLRNNAEIRSDSPEELDAFESR
jgi:hypothetical protein